MSNTTISGDVVLGQRNYFGNNSSIREKLTITDDVIVGMNACVVKDINESGTYVGVPVKKIK
jgi:UDP-3-O-[3-hydroxymyristoyl] glucosamine N-acyltransferase